MKKIIFIFSLLIFLSTGELHAQGLQPGECAIMFTYDAAGNLIQREFFCNNSGAIVYRTSKDGATKSDSSKKISGKNPTSQAKSNPDEIIKINALMPNPTTGKFMVRLAEPLVNANVLLLDVNGKVLERRLENGQDLNFNISNQPSGAYFVRIEASGNIITFKVIKQ